MAKINIAALRSILSAKDRGLSEKGREAGPLRSMIRAMVSGAAVFLLCDLGSEVPTFSGSNDKGKPKFSEGWGTWEQSHRSLAGNSLNDATGKRPYGYNEENSLIPRKFVFDVCRNPLSVGVVQQYADAGVQFWDCGTNQFVPASDVVARAKSGGDMRGGLFARIDDASMDLSQEGTDQESDTDSDSEVTEGSEVSDNA